MLFIDFVTLMLFNMAAGLFILAGYVYRGFDDVDQRRWAPAFAMVGFVALMNGFRMSWTWPLPGSYNVAYGDMSVLFGILFAGAAVALAFGWSLTPVSIYAFFAGLASILTGVRFASLGMSLTPGITAAGFIFTGLGGVFAAPTVYYLQSNRLFRAAGALVLVGAGVIWAVTGYSGYWIHLQSFGKWAPIIHQ